MRSLIYLVGLVACIWLISDNEPGSFLFAWGAVFAVVNTGALLFGEDR